MSYGYVIWGTSFSDCKNYEVIDFILDKELGLRFDLGKFQPVCYHPNILALYDTKEEAEQALKECE